MNRPIDPREHAGQYEELNKSLTNKYGLTEREKAIWPPKKKLDSFDCLEAAFWFLMGCVLIATLVHFTIEPKIMHKGTTAIVKEHPLSDREQDEQNCAYAMHGTPVHGANVNQLETYCMSHG